MTKRSDPRRTKRWQTIRQQILAADDTCHICNTPGADSVDHLVPLSKGGEPFDPDNLAPAHNICNKRRSDNPQVFPQAPRLPRPPTFGSLPVRRVSPWSGDNDRGKE